MRPEELAARALCHDAGGRGLYLARTTLAMVCTSQPPTGENNGEYTLTIQQATANTIDDDPLLSAAEIRLRLASRDFDSVRAEHSTS